MTPKIDYYADFAMTRLAKIGDGVAVKVKQSDERIEICSFDLEEPLPILVLGVHDGEPMLSTSKDVEYRRMNTHLDPMLIRYGSIDIRKMTLEHMVDAMGLR